MHLRDGWDGMWASFACAALGVHSLLTIGNMAGARARPCLTALKPVAQVRRARARGGSVQTPQMHRIQLSLKNMHACMYKITEVAHTILFHYIMKLLQYKSISESLIDFSKFKTLKIFF